MLKKVYNTVIINSKLAEKELEKSENRPTQSYVYMRITCNK